MKRTEYSYRKKYSVRVFQPVFTVGRSFAKQPRTFGKRSSLLETLAVTVGSPRFILQPLRAGVIKGDRSAPTFLTERPARNGGLSIRPAYCHGRHRQ